MSNCRDITTMTCQRNRTVSVVAIVSMHQTCYCDSIFLWRTVSVQNEDSNKTQSVWKISGQHHVIRVCLFEYERKQRKIVKGKTVRVCKAFHRFSVIFLHLRHLIVFRCYQEPITMSRLFTPLAPVDPKVDAVAVAIGCSLGIVEKRPDCRMRSACT